MRRSKKAPSRSVHRKIRSRRQSRKKSSHPLVSRSKGAGPRKVGRPRGKHSGQPGRIRTTFEKVLLRDAIFTKEGFDRLLHKKGLIKTTSDGKRRAAYRLLQTLRRVPKKDRGSVILAKITISYKTARGRRKKVELEEGAQVIARIGAKNYKDYIERVVPQGIFDTIIFTLKERSTLIQGYGARFLERIKGKKISSAKLKRIPQETRITITLEGKKI